MKVILIVSMLTCHAPLKHKLRTFAASWYGRVCQPLDSKSLCRPGIHTQPLNLASFRR